MSMSNPNPFNYDNPYGSPVATGIAPVATAMPGLSKVMFILAIIFSSLRVLLVPLSVLGYSTLKEGDPLITSVIFEIVTGGAIAVFGLLSNSLLLARKGLGIPLAWLYIFSVFGSLGVAGWQTVLMFGQFEPGTPEFVGAMIGGIIAVVIRVVLVGLYIAALLKYVTWFRAQPR